VIAHPEAYLQAVEPAFEAAREGHIAVLGIQPRWPETGYGYIEFEKGVRAGASGARPVLSFREKPDLETATKYVDAGCFFWNAGMFFWRASVVLENLRKHLPKTATLLAGLPGFADPEFAARVKEVFPLCENISIDYAVLEKAEGVVGIACGEFGWNDVGSWDAVYELLPRDASGNSGEGLLVRDASGNFVQAGKKLVALLGVKDLIVIDTPDAILVADRNRAQQVGELVKMLEKQGREELL
jgi:mannose-1-phosphate guanylyltransferase